MTFGTLRQRLVSVNQLNAADLTYSLHRRLVFWSFPRYHESLKFLQWSARRFLTHLWLCATLSLDTRLGVSLTLL